MKLQNVSKFLMINHVVFAYTLYTSLPLCPPACAGDAHADEVVVGITVVCALLLFLITLMIPIGYFIFKKNDDKKGGPEVSS